MLDKDTRNAIRRGFNRAAAEKEAVFVPLPDADLLLIVAVDARRGAFQAGLVRRSACRFDGPDPAVPTELPPAKLYAAAFDALQGMRTTPRETGGDAALEASIADVHSELKDIFDEIARKLLGA